MKKLPFVLSVIFFSILLLFFVFFKGYIFLSVDGILLFLNSPSVTSNLDDHISEYAVTYDMWINGEKINITAKSSFYIALHNPYKIEDDRTYGFVSFNKNDFIKIQVQQEEYMIQIGALLSAEYNLLQNNIGNDAENNTLTRRRLTLLRKYFFRCFNNDFLFIDEFNGIQFNYWALVFIILHGLLHYKLVKKEFFIKKTETVNSRKRSVLVSSLSVISCLILISNVLFRIISII